MAIALVGYFGTMVAVLATLMMFLNTFIASSSLERVKPQPHPRPAFAQTIEPEKKLAQPGQWGPSIVHVSTDLAAPGNLEEPRMSSVARADTEKSKRVKMARQQRRKVLARDREEQAYTATLGYNQEPSYRPVFGPFGTDRF